MYELAEFTTSQVKSEYLQIVVREAHKVCVFLRTLLCVYSMVLGMCL